jgi:hypothetical protein
MRPNEEAAHSGTPARDSRRIGADRDADANPDLAPHEHSRLHAESDEHAVEHAHTGPNLDAPAIADADDHADTYVDTDPAPAVGLARGGGLARGVGALGRRSALREADRRDLLEGGRAADIHANVHEYADEHANTD